MKAFLKKWGVFCILGAAALVVFGILAWNSGKLSDWNPKELAVSQSPAAAPGLELTLNLEEYPIGVTFTNNSEFPLESCASVGKDADDVIFFLGLEVLLDGVWYIVPSRVGDSAGIGLNLEPGNAVNGRAGLSLYGQLPDGHYRASYSAWLPGAEEVYVAYAYFDAANRRCVSPGTI